MSSTPSGPTKSVWLAAAISSLLLFASVFVHEVSHAIMAVSRGVAVRSITLFIFGGVTAMVEEPKRPRDEFVIAGVGPLTSIFLAIGFAVAALALDYQEEKPVAAVLEYLAFINLILAVFNLLPGFPLDGGRLLRAVLWARLGDLVRATRWAALAGSGLAFILMTGGSYRVRRAGAKGMRRGHDKGR